MFTLLKALATFVVSFFMGMVGLVLGVIIYGGLNEQLLEMEANHQILAKAIAFMCIGGSAILGGIFGLQKGARWTGLFDSPDF